MGEPTLSHVMPFLQAGLICDAGVVDPHSGKKTLIGIFDRIIARDFPTRRMLSIYMRMSDAAGHYRFQLEFAQVATGAILATAESEVVQLFDRTKAFDILVPLGALEIPASGAYEFRIKANNAFLGLISLEAISQT